MEQENPKNEGIATTGGKGGGDVEPTLNLESNKEKGKDSNNSNNLSSKPNALSNDPNKQKSNNNNNKNNASNEPEMKNENDSKDSEFIVFVTSLKIPFEKNMIDELRNEESDLLEMARDQPPNHSGIVAFGKRIGLTGDKLGYYAEKLATKLIKKYGNNQSNGM